MAIPILYLTKNDLQPYYYVTVQDSNGNNIDLTGATIVCTMKNIDTGLLTINRASSGIYVSNQTTNPGEFELRWSSEDTDEPGTYYIEFEITPQIGGKFTLPNRTYGEAVIVILDSLDTV